MPPGLVERTPRTWLTRAARDDLAAAVAEVAAGGGGPLRWWVSDPSAADVAAAAGAGLVPERDLWQLRIDLPLTGDGPLLPVRSFVVGRDEDAWLAVNNRAFDWHPEQGGWTVAMLAARQAEPWFDPEGFLLHERDGRLAGFVWTKVHPATGDEPAMGEIFVVAVDPDLTGQGLGRALTVAGFAWLHRERGIDVGMLYVDADNEAAVHLYGSMGMRRHHVDRAFLGEVAPAG